MNHTVIMSAGNEYLSGNVMLMKEVFIPKSVISFMIQTFDPSLTKVVAGEMTLTCPGPSVNATWDILIGRPENKIGDVLLWHTMSEAGRAAYFHYAPNSLHPDVSTEQAITNRNLNIVAVLTLTYLLHGSIANLKSKVSLVPKFALEASGMKASEFKPSALSSCKTFAGVKFTSLIRSFAGVIQHCPETMKSRFVISFAAGRIFTIIGMIRAQILTKANAHPFLAFMAEPGIIEGAPYYSMHPDHDHNPMRNSAKKIFGIIGDFCRQNNILIDDLKARKKEVFLPDIVKAMSLMEEDASGVSPDIGAFRFACSEEMSIRHLIAQA